MKFIIVNKVIGIEVDQFLKDFVFFTKNHFSHVLDYYQGKARRNAFVFTELARLKRVAIEIITGFQNNQTAFVNMLEWEILEAVEETNVRIDSIMKISKYLRSSILLATYNDGIQNKEYVLKQGQYLEGVSWTELKSNDPNNDWVAIAVENDLKEEDYAADTMMSLKLNYRNPGTVNEIKVVVDNITGENILGKDLLQLLTFYEDDETPARGDLLVLSPKGTVAQSTNILLNLLKNDNPEFWQDGTSSHLMGNTLVGFAYPILFRELSRAFSTDDTLSSFQIENIRVEKDAILMDVAVETILGDMIKGELSL